MHFSKVIVVGIVSIVGLLLTGCQSENSIDIEPETIVSLTDAELALKSVTADNSSAIVFTISPVSRTSCKSMSVDISRQDEMDGSWIPISTHTAAFDLVNPGQRIAIGNQLQYGVLDELGTYGITSVKCDPFEGESLVWRKLVATFDLKYGEVNYIGNIEQYRILSNSYVYGLTDKAESIRAKIETENPTLLPYFQKNLAAEQSLKNHTGRDVTVADIVNNVDESSDYFALRMALVQKIRRVKTLSHQASIGTYKGTGRGKQTFWRNLYNLQNLVNLSHETLYVFDELVAKRQDFSAIEAYIKARQVVDRADALHQACQTLIGANSYIIIPGNADSCGQSFESLSSAQEQELAILYTSALDLSESEAETKLLNEREELYQKVSEAEQAYLRHVSRLGSREAKFMRDKTIKLSAAQEEALAAVEYLDAKRFFARYNPSKKEQERYLNALEEMTKARHEYFDLQAQRLGNPEFQGQEAMGEALERFQKWEKILAKLHDRVF